MRSCKLFLISLFVLVSTAGEIQAQAPALVTEPNRTVSATRSGNTQSFQVASSILNETRRIAIVLPPSFSQSAPERRYPVMVVTDGDFLLAPVAAVSDELTRNG